MAAACIHSREGHVAGIKSMGDFYSVSILGNELPKPSTIKAR